MKVHKRALVSWIFLFKVGFSKYSNVAGKVLLYHDSHLLPKSWSTWP